MTDKWEICWVDGNHVIFASPSTAVKKMDLGEYFKTKGMSKPAWTTYGYDVYPYLLDDGWEPFASENLHIRFRRKYQG
ncbi:MAG: hypothetical protein ABSF99_02820 [Anaerolineales bacterium]|jgi:hypothetical protein